jgi:hypothetical protein
MLQEHHGNQTHRSVPQVSGRIRSFVEEVPGANTQGATLKEARDNLKEAVTMVLQANRELAEESLRGAEVVREPKLSNKTRRISVWRQTR